MMALSSDFVHAVESKDITLVRIMLSDNMLVDLTLNQFNERLVYAENKLEGLYDEHDGEEFSNDITKWDKNLLDDQMVKVVTNFSKERVSFLKQLVRHVYAAQAQARDREQFANKKNAGAETQKKVGVGIAACGAAVAVVGLAASVSEVVIAGVAVAAVGGIVVVASQIEK